MSARGWKLLMLLSTLLYCIALNGCTAAQKQVITDVKDQCGAQTIDAIGKTQAVLFAVTSVETAIAGIADIIGAAVSDAKAIACIVRVAVADLRSKQAASVMAQATADPNAQARAMGDQILRRLGQ